MISERIKAAMAAAKAKGKKFGLALRSKAWRRQVSALGHAAVTRAAKERAEAYRLHIEWAFRQPSAYGVGDRFHLPLQPKSSTIEISNHRWVGVGREQLLRMGLRLG